MDIDVQGARQFVEAYPLSVLVFIRPPTSSVLLERLSGRGTEAKASLERRLKSALAELQAIGMYHYVVVNEDLDKAVDAISEIIDAEEMRTSRNTRLGERVGELVTGLEEALKNNKGSN
jgi:guanylate kinase